MAVMKIITPPWMFFQPASFGLSMFRGQMATPEQIIAMTTSAVRQHVFGAVSLAPIELDRLPVESSPKWQQEA